MTVSELRELLLEAADPEMEVEVDILFPDDGPPEPTFNVTAQIKKCACCEDSSFVIFGHAADLDAALA